MKLKSLTQTTSLCLTLAVSYCLFSPAVMSQNGFVAGPKGIAGVSNRKGQYGSRFAGGALGRNQGMAGSTATYNGPNGNNLNTAGGLGYKRGVGAFQRRNWNGKTAKGGTGSGSSNNYYNAKTGQGVSNNAAQVHSAAGQNYGYTENGNYQKGQGGNTVIQTDNKGTYDINTQPGQKPVVTKTPAAQ